MGNTAIKVENLSKIYRLGEIGTGSIGQDVDRWFKTKILGKEDPFLKIGESNDRATKGASDFVYSLQDINFEINQGDAVGIIGRNGAGKSTLLKILSRVTTPTTGKINIKGRVASLLEVGTGFHPELTGRENIYLNGAILGMRKREIDRKLDEIIDFSGVERYIDTPVKRYSSGMYVRLAFAVAAHLESEILIVDEVLAVGDAEFQQKCIGKMGDISKGEGRTVLFVSHNLTAIERLCFKSLLFENGKLNYSGLTTSCLDIYRENNASVNEVYFERNDFLKYLSFYQNKSNLKIICEYDCKNVLQIPCLGFVVADSAGNKLFGSNPKYQLPKDTLKPSRAGKFDLTITSPKLLNGRYFLSIWFGDGKEDSLFMENVISTEVVNMVSYFEETTASASGPISPQIEWGWENF
jgi:lipopolysaccharide transport system ATP-binding protein